MTWQSLQRKGSTSSEVDQQQICSHSSIDSLFDKELLGAMVANDEEEKKSHK